MGVGVGLAFLVVVVLVYVFPETDLKRVMAWSVDGTGPNERIARVPGAACEPESAVEEGPVAPAGIARATDPRYGLSQRELEILDLFAQGRSANWIADNFTISKNTVRSHLRAIYTKLDVHTRQELLDFLEG